VLDADEPLFLSAGDQLAVPAQHGRRVSGLPIEVAGDAKNVRGHSILLLFNEQPELDESD
jgi:hypothetical protein